MKANHVDPDVFAINISDWQLLDILGSHVTNLQSLNDRALHSNTGYINSNNIHDGDGEVSRHRETPSRRGITPD